MSHLKYTIYGATFVYSTAVLVLITLMNTVKSTMFIIQPRGIATDGKTSKENKPHHFSLHKDLSSHA